MARIACPIDGTRLVQVTSTNAAGDDIHRWECPLADWRGPWYTGLDVDEIHQIPETGRATSFEGKVGSAGAAGTEYTEGAVDATITGTAIMWEDAADTLRAVSATNRLPVSLPAGGSGLTDAELRATPVPVSGTVTATGPLTDAQLRAVAVPVSGPLTDAQLRATPVPVSGTVTATGPLTDAQLRASAVPVSATQLPVALAAGGGLKVEGVAGGVAQPVSGTFWQATQPVSGTVTANAGTGPFPVSDNAGSLTVDAPVGTPVFVRLSDGAAPIATLPVSGPLTDAQLRASAVPVSLAANQSINLVQLGGVAIATGSGASSTGTQRVIEAGPAAADILVGHVAQTATTAAATVITVPINRTWRGTITITCDVANAATAALVGQALGTVTTTGASAVPAAGTIATCEARVGTNAATGTHGTGAANSITIPITVSAGATALATIALASTQAGTNSRVACIASGTLI